VSQERSSTYNDFTLNTQVSVLMQPNLHSCLRLEELKDQELRRKRLWLTSLWLLTIGLIMSLCSLRG